MFRALLAMARHPIFAARITWALYRDLRGLTVEEKLTRLQQVQSEVARLQRQLESDDA